MKPSFALSLSFEGIALLHRAAGGWHSVGEVALDVPDLTGALADLRARALRLEPGGIACKLIIPNDQIRYLTLDTGPAEGEARRSKVRQALDGATPYAVADLAFDISVEGQLTHVAAVARETLAEAEAFAVEHQFNPLSFVAVPGDQPFLGEPFFGLAENAGDARVEADGIAVVVTGEAKLPEPEPEPEETPAQDPQEAEAPQTAVPDTPAPTKDAAAPEAPQDQTTAPDPAPAVGFSSRRSKEGAAPALAGASRAAPAKPAAAPDAPVGKAAATARPVPVAAPPAAQVVASARIAQPDRSGAAQPAATAAKLQQAIGGLLSLRGAAKPAAAKSETTTRPSPAASLIAPPPATQPPVAQDETERMTLFGARKSQRVGGKPRYLGLILTLVLLLFLAAVAAWAALFLDGGVAGLFRAAPEETRLAAAPEPEVTAPPPAEPPLTEAQPPQRPAELAALPPEIAPTADPEPTDTEPAALAEPQAPELTDTDSAVLQALRGDTAGSAAVDMTDPELEAEPEPGLPSDLTDADDETFYAATGIWPSAPEAPETPAIIGLNDLYVASIDRTDLSQDAVALPAAAGFETDAGLNAVASPAAAGQAFALDDRGLVTATPDGTLSPDGVVVYQGRPPVVPPALPARLVARAEAAAETDALRQHLAGLRPRGRPTDLIEQTERAQLGGRSRNELGRLRPRLRPQGLQDAAAAADATPTAEPDDASATAQAVAVALVPKPRPRDLAASARGSERASIGIPDTSAAPEPEPAAVTPKIPSSASVARQATLKNEINLRQLNLIGIYGTAANRRALIRLPSGRYKKVKVGDTVDGGKVIAIGETELRYQKGGRNLTLKIPSS